jgi:hypothetical protein
MYHFMVGGEQYRARFQYDREESTYIQGKEDELFVKGVTKCLVERQVGEKVWELVVEGHAWCSVSDQFNRVVGRRVAMDRATQDLGTVFRSAAFGEMFKRRVKA